MSEFESIEKLYHFTNFEAACKILASKTLLLSPLANLNDVNESFRAVYSDKEGKFFSWKDLGGKFRQLSLAEDDVDCPGFLNLPMWGHYGDKGRGVCIVLDKSRFEDMLNKLQDKMLWHGKIEYVDSYNNELRISGENDVIANYKDIFFKKDRCWIHECEYRVVSYDAELTKIGIGECIKWVILYYSGEESILNLAEYKALAKLLGSTERILVYSRFLGEDSIVSYNDKGVAVEHWSRQVSGAFS